MEKGGLIQPIIVLRTVSADSANYQARFSRNIISSTFFATTLNARYNCLNLFDICFDFE
jgi:hypothetical protein